MRLKSLKFGCHLGNEKDLVSSRPFQGDSSPVFVLHASKPEGWEKIGYTDLEICMQIFEETRVIQDTGQFTGI